ncbi:aminoacyl-tRNA hydrolase [Nocardiopsis sp. CNT-189]|uniref:alternative ribosome rescue aminoacyl-tRNA hydrolase ArfB n=1 Tax=Nocardiopsis oceanisediminis TaxID=2816862 RepID=UPI003B35635A
MGGSGTPPGAGPELPEAELVWRFSRSSGPGGQHVNTSDTRVSVSLDLAATSALTERERERALERLAGRLRGGVLTVTASDSRSQARNRELARERLAELVRGACAPPPKARRATRPSRAARQRRLDGKHRRSQLKRTRSRRFED